MRCGAMSPDGRWCRSRNENEKKGERGGGKQMGAGKQMGWDFCCSTNVGMGRFGIEASRPTAWVVSWGYLGWFWVGYSVFSKPSIRSRLLHIFSLWIFCSSRYQRFAVAWPIGKSRSALSGGFAIVRVGVEGFGGSTGFADRVCVRFLCFCFSSFPLGTCNGFSSLIMFHSLSKQITDSTKIKSRFPTKRCGSLRLCSPLC